MLTWSWIQSWGNRPRSLPDGGNWIETPTLRKQLSTPNEMCPPCLFVFSSLSFYVLPPSPVIKCPASQHSQNTISNLNNDFQPLYPFIRSRVQFSALLLACLWVCVQTRVWPLTLDLKRQREAADWCEQRQQLCAHESAVINNGEDQWGKTLVSDFGCCLLRWQISVLFFSLFLGCKRRYFIIQNAFFLNLTHSCAYKTLAIVRFSQTIVSGSRWHCAVTVLDAVLSVCSVFNAFCNKPCWDKVFFL